MMFALSLLLVSLSVISAERLTCGTETPPQWHIDQLKVANVLAPRAAAAAADINIDTYVHVITDTSQGPDFYTQDMVYQQIEVLNNAFVNMSISFILRGTDFTLKDAWSTPSPDSQTEREMKQALRQGGQSYSVLNLYFVPSLGGNIRGHCRFPFANPTADQIILDGCMVLALTLPDAPIYSPAYDRGYTAVHETGHWFALYHPFARTSALLNLGILGCTGAGDEVDDTPQQLTPTEVEGCPYTKDSCPLSPGRDNVQNFMDYSDDYCMTSFTPGQSTRARRMYQGLRAGK